MKKLSLVLVAILLLSCCLPLTLLDQAAASESDLLNKDPPAWRTVPENHPIEDDTGTIAIMTMGEGHDVQFLRGGESRPAFAPMIMVLGGQDNSPNFPEDVKMSITVTDPNNVPLNSSSDITFVAAECSPNITPDYNNNLFDEIGEATNLIGLVGDLNDMSDFLTGVQIPYFDYIDKPAEVLGYLSLMGTWLEENSNPEGIIFTPISESPWTTFGCHFTQNTGSTGRKEVGLYYKFCLDLRNHPSGVYTITINYDVKIHSMRFDGNNHLLPQTTTESYQRVLSYNYDTSFQPTLENVPNLQKHEMTVSDTSALALGDIATVSTGVGYASSSGTDQSPSFVPAVHVNTYGLRNHAKEIQISVTGTGPNGPIDNSLIYKPAYSAICYPSPNSGDKSFKYVMGVTSVLANINPLLSFHVGLLDAYCADRDPAQTYLQNTTNGYRFYDDLGQNTQSEVAFKFHLNLAGQPDGVYTLHVTYHVVIEGMRPLGAMNAMIGGDFGVCDYSEDITYTYQAPPPLKPTIYGPYENVAGVYRQASTMVENREYLFAAVASDPHHQDIRYVFNWGDSTTPTEIGWTISGQHVEARHTWSSSSPSQKTITVSAYGACGEPSQSGQLTINIQDRVLGRPSKPSGPTTVYIGQPATYYTSAVDPDGNSLRYVFHWDGYNTDTTPSSSPSGQTVSMSHTWNSVGTYSVWAQSIDPWDKESYGGDFINVQVIDGNYYSLTVSKTGSGTIYPSGTAMYQGSTYVPVTAIPDSGNMHYWNDGTGALDWNQTNYIYLSGNTSAVAHFVPATSYNFISHVESASGLNYDSGNIVGPYPNELMAGLAATAGYGDESGEIIGHLYFTTAGHVYIYGSGYGIIYVSTSPTGYEGSWTCIGTPFMSSQNGWVDCGYNLEPFSFIKLKAQDSVYSLNIDSVKVDPTTYNLAISTTTGGSTTPSGTTNTYLVGTYANVHANDVSGLMFTEWLLDNNPAGNNPSIDVYMDGNHELQAVYTSAVGEAYVSSIYSYGGVVDANSIQNLLGQNPNGQYAYISSYIPGYCPDFGYITGQLNTLSTGSISVYGSAIGYGGRQLYVYAMATESSSPVLVSTVTVQEGSSYWIDCGSYSGPIRYIKLTCEGNPEYGISIDAVLVVPPPPQYTLTVNQAGNGSVTKNPNQVTYTSGSSVQLTAVPAEGYQFAGWSGDVTGTTNPVTITMNSHKIVNATFTPILSTQYSLDVNLVGSGSVTTSPNQNTFTSATSVQLTATPNTGYQFAGWSGDVTGTTNPVTITMNGHKSVTATFTQIQNALNINVVGGGSVTKSPNQGTYASGTTVQLTATPNTGYQFAGWSGDIIDSTNTITITMDAQKTLTATFTAIPQPQKFLSVTVVGSGSVTRNPDQLSYTDGSSVQLIAVPEAGYEFAGWSGALSGSTNPATITMGTDKNITATFTPIVYYYVEASAGLGGSISPLGVAKLQAGNSQGFIVTPLTGYAISQVTVDGQNQGPITSYTFQNLQANHTIQATFYRIFYTITASAGSGGSISPWSSMQVASGLNQTFTITPDSGYAISQVMVDGVNQGTISSYMFSNVIENHTIVASFVPISQLIFSDGFESGDLSTFDSNNTSTGCNVSITNEQSYSGIYSLKSVTDNSSEVAYAQKTLLTNKDSLSISLIARMPQNASKVVFVLRDSSGNVANIQFASDGRFYIWNYAGNEGYYTTTGLWQTNQWYKLIMNISRDDTAGSITLQVNDILRIDETADTNTGSSYSTIRFGEYYGEAGTLYIDNIAVCDLEELVSQYALTVNVVGGGSVTKSPNQATYASGASVELTAVPSSGYEFVAWSGALSGSTNPTTITVDSDKTVTATFVPIGSELFDDGFESGDFSPWSGTNGSPSIVASPVHHGTYGMDVNNNANDQHIYAKYDFASSQASGYLRFYVRFTNALPTTNSVYLGGFETPNLTYDLATLMLKNDGGSAKFVLEYQDNALTMHSVTANTVPVANTWYCVELYSKVGSGDGEAKLYINGVLDASDADISNSNLSIDLAFVGVWCSGGYLNGHVYYDCIEVSSSYIGPETAFEDGFEGNDFSAWSTTNGSPTTQSALKHHGNYSMQCDGSWAYDRAEKALSGATTYYGRAYVRLSDLPTNGNTLSLMSLLCTDGSYVPDVVFGVKNWGGAAKWGITWCSGSTTESTHFASTSNPVADTWYCIELKVTANPNSYDWAFWVDGISLKNGTHEYTPSGNVNRFMIGTWDNNDDITVYFDCAKVATEYIGPEPSTTYNLTVSSTAGGTTTPSAGIYSITAGSYQFVNATANSGYVFDHWMLDNTNVGSTNPYNVLMDGNHTIQAIFNTTSPLLFCDGFESGLTLWDEAVYNYGGSNPTVSSTVKHDGSNSAQLQIADQTYSYSEIRKSFGTGYNTLYYRAYVRFSALPGSGEKIQLAPDIRGNSLPSDGLASLALYNDAGTCKFGLQYYTDASGDNNYVYSTSLTPTVDRWYFAEIMVNTHASAGSARLWIAEAGGSVSEGSPTLVVTGLANDNVGNAQHIVSVAYSPTGVACIVYVDDVAVSDTFIVPESLTLFEDAFESGDTSAWSWSENSPTVQSTVKHDGTYALYATSPGSAVGDCIVHGLSSSQSDAYVRFYVRYPSLPSSGYCLYNVAFFDTVWGGQVSGGVYNEGGSMAWVLATGSGYYHSHASISANTWYCIELRRETGNGNGIATMWVDGTQVINRTTETQTENAAYVYLGVVWADVAGASYIDCATIANAYIGPMSSTTYNLTISSTAGGTTAPSSGTYNLTAGTYQSVNATAGSGYVFDHWLLDNVDVGSANPYSVLMNSNHTLQALFESSSQVLFDDGFESGDFSAWTGANGSPSIVTSPVHHGTYGMDINNNVNGQQIYTKYDFPSSRMSAYLRFYIRFTNVLPTTAGTLYLGGFETSNLVTDLATLQLKNDGGVAKFVLQYQDNTWNSFTINANTVPVENTWYCIELYSKIGNGDGEVKLYINGTLDASAANITNNNYSIQTAFVGVYADCNINGHIYYDCVKTSASYIGLETGGAIFSDGFESGLILWDEAVYGNGGTNPTVSSTTKYNGSYSGQLQIADQSWSYSELRKSFGVGYDTLYYSSYIRFSALPGSGESLDLSPDIRGDTLWADLLAGLAIYNDAGTCKFGLTYYTDSGVTTTYTTSLTPTVNTWYFAEVMVSVDSYAGAARLWIAPAGSQVSEGSPTIAVTGLANDDVGNSQHIVVTAYSESGTACMYYVDDIAVSDSFIGTQASSIYDLTISSTTGGTTNPSAGIYVVAAGTNQSVSATAEGEYSFDHWLLDSVNVGDGNPYVVQMNSNHTLQAVFVSSAQTIFSNDFESGDFSGWTSTSGSGTKTIVDTISYSGDYSGQFSISSAGSSAYAYKTFSSTNEVYARFYVLIPTLPTSTSYHGIVSLRDLSASQEIARLAVTNWGWGSTPYTFRLQSVVGALGNFDSSVMSLNANQWYCIEIHALIDNSNGVFQVWLDGNLIINASGVDNDNGATEVDTILVGCTSYNGQANTKYIDCVEVADAYIGPETIFEDGFESGNFNAFTDAIVWGENSSRTVTNTGSANNGSYHSQFTAGLCSEGANMLYKTIDSQAMLNGRCYLKLDRLPAESEFIEFISLSQDSAYWSGGLALTRISGALKWAVSYNNGGTWYTAYADASVTTGVYYCIEYASYQHSSSGYAKAWINGNQVINVTGLNTATNTATLNRLEVGMTYAANIASTASWYIDDVAVASQYIGPI